jgi:hypothetical protein
VTVALADRGCAAMPTHVFGMSPKRRAPRDHAVNPERFGKPGLPISWLPVDQADLTEQAELVAAQWQHALAVELRQHATERHGSVEAFASATGQNASHLDAVLEGASWMRLDDLGRSIIRPQDGVAE